MTVTGASQTGYRSSIDRRSYGIATDLHTVTGSINDALRNIPSVEVDPQGGVRLRGDSHVQILIDGKPSGLFTGASAADALQSMPADSIERVEVITNPSADMSAEGSAGIINLITKKIRKPGRSGSVRVNVSPMDQENFGVTGALNTNKVVLSVDAGARHQRQKQSSSEDRTFSGNQGGGVESSFAETSGDAAYDQWNGRAHIDYDLDSKTQLSGELRYDHFDFEVDRHEHFMAQNGDGLAIQNFEEPGRSTRDRGTGAAQLSLARSFAGDAHTLAINISRDRTDQRLEQQFTQIPTLPVAPDLFSNLHSVDVLTFTHAKIDYARPMPADGKLKVGYELRINDDKFDDVGLRGTALANAQPDPTQTNLFLYKQTINAAYVTYEQPIGIDWTVLGGLRLEAAAVDLNQVTADLIHHATDTRIYPSLHVRYRLSDDQQLSFSYSKRVQRPGPQDLNPFQVEVDPLNFHAGNPSLKPQLTDSFEAEWEYKSGDTLAAMSLYYRHNEHGVTDVVTSLGGGALLTTRDNLSESRVAGAELVAAGHLTKTLTYSVSTDLYWNEIDARGEDLGDLLDVQGRRSAFLAGARGSLTWQTTLKDSVEFNAQINAKQLVPQGYLDPTYAVFLGYKHKFNDAFSLVVTVQDILNSYRFHQLLATDSFRDRTTVLPNARAVFVGLTWSFGSGSAKKPRDPDFDFNLEHP